MQVGAGKPLKGRPGVQDLAELMLRRSQRITAGGGDAREGRLGAVCRGQGRRLKPRRREAGPDACLL